jgi:hypothetical protein
MSSEAKAKILRLIEQGANAAPTAVEFEMAYQARVAMDRIRFAIRVTEHAVDEAGTLREANLQLLDALGRLETAEQSFQRKCRPNGREPKWAHDASRAEVR